MSELIFLLVLFLIFTTVFFITNIKHKKYRKKFLHFFKDSFELKINRIKCETKYSGFNDKRLNFRICDLYVNEDVIVVISDVLIGGFTMYAKPIIITMEVSKYKKLNSIAKISSLKSVKFKNSNLLINFLHSKDAQITIYNITDSDRIKIESIIKKLINMDLGIE